VGKRLTVVDESGNCSATATIGISAAGADMINGATSVSLATPFGYAAVESDGVSKWTILERGTVASSQISDSTASGRALLTAASVATQRQLLRIDQHTNVSDANYAALATDQLVAFTAITAARTVTLPAASAVNAGQPLVIADESGSCSATNTITVARSGTDTINGATSAVIASPFGYLELVSNGSNKWTVIDTSITSTNIADASAIGKAILTAPNVAAERGIILDQRTPVGDANYSILSTDRYVATSAALSAPRIWTLPPASAMNAGQEVVIYDEAGGVTATNTLTILRSGSDIVNGASSFTLNRAFQGISLRTDGVGKWAFEDEAGPIDGTAIGATTPSTGAFTSLSAASLSTTSLSAASLNGGAFPIRGYLAGLTLSNDATSPNTTVDISAGVCAADDASLIMSLGAFTKTTGAWVVGNGNGGLDTGTVAASTWYHVFVIERTDTNVVDALISLSATSPTLPANYTKKRRIGSVRTDASSHILAFSQNGDEFLWAAAVGDVNTSSLGTTATLLTLTVPIGVKVNALYRFAATAGNGILINSPDESALAFNVPVGNVTSDSAVSSGAGGNTRTNVNGQIRATAGASSTLLQLVTYGWIDTRGKFN
jgi:hypothetical protein